MDFRVVVVAAAAAPVVVPISQECDSPREKIRIVVGVLSSVLASRTHSTETTARTNHIINFVLVVGMQMRRGIRYYYRSFDERFRLRMRMTNGRREDSGSNGKNAIVAGGAMNAKKTI